MTVLGRCCCAGRRCDESDPGFVSIAAKGAVVEPADCDGYFDGGVRESGIRENERAGTGVVRALRPTSADLAHRTAALPRPILRGRRRELGNYSAQPHAWSAPRRLVTRSKLRLSDDGHGSSRSAIASPENRGRPSRRLVRRRHVPGISDPPRQLLLGRPRPGPGTACDRSSRDQQDRDFSLTKSARSRGGATSMWTTWPWLER